MFNLTASIWKDINVNDPRFSIVMYLTSFVNSLACNILLLYYLFIPCTDASRLNTTAGKKEEKTK